MKRNFSISVRISEAEHQALVMVAQREGITPSECARMIIHEACNQRGLPIGLFGTRCEVVAEVGNGQPQQS